jgi:hypothetical protein
MSPRPRGLAAYPPDWKTVARRIKDAAGWKCERCGGAHSMEGAMILTVHHLDGDKRNCADWNLAALCQRCHLRIQGRVKMQQMFFEQILDVAQWFKPHLEGYLRSKSAEAEQVSSISGPCVRCPEAGGRAQA